MKFLVVVWVCAFALRAHAQPALAVEYKAPDDCVHLPTIRAEVAGKLGRDPFAAEASRRAIIEIWHTTRGYFAQIDLSEAAQSTKHRSIGPFDTCAEATSALDDALVTIVDPMHDESPHFTPHTAPNDRSGNSVTIRIEPVPPTTEVAVTLGGLVGSIPAAFAVGITAGFRLPHARASAFARYASGSDTYDGIAARGGDTQLGIDVCARYWYVEGCGLLGFGYRSISGEEVVEDSGAHVIVGVRIGAEIPINKSVFVRPALEITYAGPENDVVRATDGLTLAVLGTAMAGGQVSIGYVF